MSETVQYCYLIRKVGCEALDRARFGSVRRGRGVPSKSLDR